MATEQYLNWGCESLDLVDHTAPLYPETVGAVYNVPIEIVEAIVDHQRLGSIRFADRHGIATLASKISAQGQLEPGLAYYNGSKIKLQDGHHRYLARKEHLEMKTFKLKIQESPGSIQGGKGTYTTIMDILFSGLNRG